MRWIALVASALLAVDDGSAEPRIPIEPGQYTFQHRFAEHPTIPSIVVKATIVGRRITLANTTAAGPFPAGVLAEGELMWHAGSRQWVIGHQPSDRFAQDVGGCSDGPEVVDLASRIYWTC